jgi:hypothetical protein
MPGCRSGGQAEVAAGTGAGAARGGGTAEKAVATAAIIASGSQLI